MIKAGAWMIGSNPSRNAGSVSTLKTDVQVWPNETTWGKYFSEGKWQADRLLAVTGKKSYL